MTCRYKSKPQIKTVFRPFWNFLCALFIIKSRIFWFFGRIKCIIKRVSKPKRHHQGARCLKITEKVSFNIVSEVSYVYILSGQKLIKNAKKRSILASFWKPEACGQTVLPDRSILMGQKLVENAEIQKFKCDIFGWFSNTFSLRVTKKRTGEEKKDFESCLR